MGKYRVRRVWRKLHKDKSDKDAKKLGLKPSYTSLIFITYPHVSHALKIAWIKQGNMLQIKES